MSDTERRVISLQKLAAMMDIDSSALRMRMYRSPENYPKPINKGPRRKKEFLVSDVEKFFTSLEEGFEPAKKRGRPRWS